MNFAVLNGNVVENVIVADSKETAEMLTNGVCIEYTDENPAGVGWTYDFENQTFTSPFIQEVILDEVADD